MTLFAALDATRVADRRLDDADPDRWSRPIPTAPRAALVSADRYSWWALARNPNALLLSGMLGAAALHDALRAAIR